MNIYIITLNFTQSYLKDECDMAFCSDCGYVLLDGVKFCSNCGVKVKESIANPTVEVKQLLPKPTGSQFDLSTTSKSYVQNTTLQTDR